MNAAISQVMPLEPAISTGAPAPPKHTLSGMSLHKSAVSVPALPAAIANGSVPPSALSALLPGAHLSTLDVDVSGLDWNDIARKACKACMGGLLLAAANRHGWRIPERPLAWLRQQALQTRLENSHMMRRLEEIAAQFLRHNVDVLLLKGAALNLTLYERADLRPMSDLDLLVRPEAATTSMTALEQLGFERGPELVRSDFFPRFHYEVEYCTDEPRPVRIDLHVRPFRPLRFAQTVPPDAFWDRSEVYDLGGSTVRVASLEDQFIHLATHSACHGHSRLLWLYDIRRLIDISGQAFDWDRVVRSCKRNGLVYPVRQALQSLEAVWGPICPDRVRQRLSSERVDWRDRVCMTQAPHDTTRPVRHVAVNLLCATGIRFRFGYLLRMLIPDRNHLGQISGRRHAGWVALAHARRWLRAGLRILWLPKAIGCSVSALVRNRLTSRRGSRRRVERFSM